MPARATAVGKRRGGGVMVEFALVAPILAFLLFGAVELGLQHRASVQLDALAREAARLASSGETPTVVSAQVQELAAESGLSGVALTLQYSYWYMGGWTSWYTLGASGDENTAPSRAVIRARVDYNYSYFMPGLMSYITGQSSQTHLIRRSVTMMRE